jgi:hypothetical protein
VKEARIIGMPPQGVKPVGLLHTQGLPCTFYSERGSHYWTTPEAGGKVDKENPTQFGRALRQLGIKMIPAYSPEARGARNGRLLPIRTG